MFRRIWDHQVGSDLSRVAVEDIVKHGSQLAASGDYPGHNLRSGLMIEAGRQGASLADEMAMSGHRSVKMVLEYFQSDAAVSNPAANLLSEKLAK